MRGPALVFGGFIAHALNGRIFAVSSGCSELLVDPGTVFKLLHEALESEKLQYLFSLLYHPQYADRLSPEEAADKYFKATLERPMFLSATVLKTAAHRVFELLCRRAGGDWATAELVRRAGAGGGTVRPLRVPREWNDVVRRLEACDHSVSQSNAATTKRKEHGPLMLVCGAAEVLVPEEMSLWQAISLGPRQVRHLPVGEELAAITSAIANAMQSLNRNFQEILSLGHRLCPFDWLDMPVNQVRGVGAFLDTVKEFGGHDVPSVWERAWAKSPVPGFRNDLEAFRTSDLGWALRSQPIRTTRNDFDRVGMEDDVTADEESSGKPTNEDGSTDFAVKEDADDGGPIGPDAFERALQVRLTDERINPLEADLLRRIYQGGSLDDLAREAKFALVFAGKPLTRVVAELLLRIEVQEAQA